MSKRVSPRVRAIRNLKDAIDELKKAIENLRDRKFESAENNIADALIFEGRALRNINKAEEKC